MNACSCRHGRTCRGQLPLPPRVLVLAGIPKPAKPEQNEEDLKDRSLALRGKRMCHHHPADFGRSRQVFSRRKNRKSTKMTWAAWRQPLHPLCILCSRPKDMNVSASCRPQDAAGPTPTRANSAQQKQRLFFHCGAASQPMNPSCNNASQLSLTKSTHGWQLQTAEFHTSHHLGRFSSAYFTCSIGEPNVS